MDPGSPLAIPPLKARSTLKDSVYRTLRTLIIDGALPPGRRLVEAELARRFGASSTPVREALVTLAAEGLVMLSPHHGAEVSRLAYAELEERLFIRDALEAAALERVVARITARELALARKHLEAMRRAMKSGNARAYRAAQRASREAWLEAAGYPQLAKLILDLQDQDVRVSLFLITARPERWAADLAASVRRLDAIARRDAAGAMAVTRRWHEELLTAIREAVVADESGLRGLLTDSRELVAPPHAARAPAPASTRSAAIGRPTEGEHAHGGAEGVLAGQRLPRRARGAVDERAREAPGGDGPAPPRGGARR